MSRPALLKALAAVVVLGLAGTGTALLGTGSAAGSPGLATDTSSSTSSTTGTSSTTTTSTSTSGTTSTSTSTSSTSTSTSSTSSTETSTTSSETSTSTTAPVTTTVTTTTVLTTTPTPPQIVSVYPIAGSHVASPKAQIAFRGVNPSLLAGIEVSGSKSGSHSGKVVGDSDNQGGSFVPDQPFTPGETVTVKTPLHLVGAANGTYGFSVATPASRLFPQAPLIARWIHGSTFRFHSRSDLQPATVRITRRSRSAGSGDIFLTPQFGPLQSGPIILDPGGDLVWFQPVPRGNIATDLRVQRYQGKPVLTWWQGYTGSGAGSGVDEIYDSSYRPVATVTAANGMSADLHEFQLTRQDTALLTAYFPVWGNASSVKGAPHQVLFDGVVQEIDIPTGLVLFQWDSLDHVPLSDSYSRPPKRPAPYDYFHVNSVAEDGDGNLVVSARNTWAAYKIRRSDGKILWTLGGKRSSFRLRSGASFAFQHDVRIHASGDRFVSLFDDGGGPPAVHPQSRALLLSLNFHSMTARAIGQDVHSPKLSANFEGNVQQLPGFDDFVGWGQQPYFTEYNRRGGTVLDGRFVSDTSSYRAYRFNWSGTPTTAPAVSATRSRGRIDVYVSWNGATNVAAWQVLTGDSATSVHPARRVAKRGFETEAVISPARYVRVQALDGHGKTLGTSPTVKAS